MVRFLSVFFICFIAQNQVLLPIHSGDRKDISKVQLTKIGQFGLMRKARPKVQAHYHTGIDIRRPGSNYESENIYPISKGVVISKRTDGPYANLILAHEINGVKLWSLYEHIAGIEVQIGDEVQPEKAIARFMNKSELDKYGWQFDHFHFEVIKVKPQKVKPTEKNPGHYYNSYSLVCYTLNDLKKYYFDPLDYLSSNLKN
jgi:murein DD-endopeptidase MepM/ murein hydrolase activator NlpD